MASANASARLAARQPLHVTKVRGVCAPAEEAEASRRVSATGSQPCLQAVSQHEGTRPPAQGAGPFKP